MKKSQEHELRKYCNDLDAYCGFKDYLYNDGPNRGLRAFDVDNGRNIEMTFLADRGLDITALRYKGKNMGLRNKVGVRSPYLYREDGGSGFLKQFYGGLLTTCGITYAGGAGEDPYPTQEEYAICVPKGQDELLAAINEVLDELGEDGVNDLVMQHMGLE